MAILNFQCPGVTRITIPTRISQENLPNETPPKTKKNQPIWNVPLYIAVNNAPSKMWDVFISLKTILKIALGLKFFRN